MDQRRAAGTRGRAQDHAREGNQVQRGKGEAARSCVDGWCTGGRGVNRRSRILSHQNQRVWLLRIDLPHEMQTTVIHGNSLRRLSFRSTVMRVSVKDGIHVKVV